MVHGKFFGSVNFDAPVAANSCGIFLLLRYFCTAAFEGVPGPEHYNPMGIVHGGYAATLLDSACGIAVVTKLTEDQAMTTLELKTSYLKAMTGKTGKVRAEGRVISIGRRVAYTEASLTDEAGRLLATATSTLLVINP